MNQDLYEKLVNTIDEHRIIQNLCEMLAIRSENPMGKAPLEGFREKEMGQHYVQKMNDLGMETQYVDVLPDRPNVFGTLKGTGEKPSLMLAGHMDTAPTVGYDDAYNIRSEDGKIYGRGACDMKAALAAYLEVVRVINDADLTLKGDLLLGGLCDEEYEMAGSKHVGKHGPHAGQGIIGEPSELDICPANKGQLGVIIRTHGLAVHSSVPEQGINAIVQMARAIQAFDDYNDELLKAPAHPLCGHGRFSPGVIHGGIMAATVPDICELEVDRRILPGETTEQILDEMRSRLEPLNHRFPDFRYELVTEPTWNIPANDVSSEEPVVPSLLSAYGQVMGRPAEIRAFVAGTDAPNMGFPTVICGPGAIGQAHGKNEYVSVEQLVNAAKIYLWCAVDLLC